MLQAIKNALKKEKDPAKALVSYRATPLENGYSPAEMLFGTKIRTTVSVFPDQLKPSWPGLQELREHEQESKLVQTKRYNVSHRCTELAALKPGGHVWVVDQKKPAVVTERDTTRRSYVVVTQDSNPIRRNRRHLVSLPQTVQQQFPQKEETFYWFKCVCLCLRKQERCKRKSAVCLVMLLASDGDLLSYQYLW